MGTQKQPINGEDDGLDAGARFGKGRGTDMGAGQVGVRQKWVERRECGAFMSNVYRALIGSPGGAYC